MTTIEHAQQIFSMLLAAQKMSGKPMPNPTELKQLVETSMIYAKAFEGAKMGKS